MLVGLVGRKKSCQCGPCIVLLDGERVLSCHAGSGMEGVAIATIESLGRPASASPVR